jgi:hypothetical protein
MQGIFLHVLADALGSLGVIISTLMIQFWGWYLADPIASLVISILILLSVVSLIQSTANILLSRVPEGMETTLRDAVIQVCCCLEVCFRPRYVCIAWQQIARHPGVQKVTQPHFWKLQGESIVGTLRVLVDDTADEASIRKHVSTLLSHCGVSDVTVQVEKQQFLALTASSIGFGNTAPAKEEGQSANSLVFTAASQSSGNPLPTGHGHSHGGHGSCDGNHHGHSHGGDKRHDDDHHGHSHGGDKRHDDDHHGHSHGGDKRHDDDHHGHSHDDYGSHSEVEAPTSTSITPKKEAGVWGAAQRRVRVLDSKSMVVSHGHSHGGVACDGSHDEPASPHVPSFSAGLVQLSTPLRPGASVSSTDTDLAKDN